MEFICPTIWLRSAASGVAATSSTTASPTGATTTVEPRLCTPGQELSFVHWNIIKHCSSLLVMPNFWHVQHLAMHLGLYLQRTDSLHVGEVPLFVNYRHWSSICHLQGTYAGYGGYGAYGPPQQQAPVPQQQPPYGAYGQGYPPQVIRFC